MAQVSRATVIAIAAACVAVVTSLIAVIVVVRRPEPEPPKPEIKRSAKRDPIKKRKVDADKVGKMYGAAKATRDGVEEAQELPCGIRTRRIEMQVRDEEGGHAGPHVTERPGVRQQRGCGPGRPIR